MGNHFFEHPMNRLMLEGTHLPQYDPEELAIKYIKIAKSGRKPTNEQVEAVKTGLLSFCEKTHGNNRAAFEADVRGIEQSWPTMHPILANSMGLTQMMLDYGIMSRFFYQYVYKASKREFAVALETKDGRAMPLSGEKVFETIPMDDWAMTVAVEDPNHSARRGTDGVCQTLLRNSKSIFEAGAGLMPAYRNYNYPLGQLDQRIVACDSDGRLLEYLPAVFGRPLEDYGIDYQVGNLLEVMDRPEYFGAFETVRMTGLLSYFRDFKDKMEVMQKAKRLLKRDGVIMTELWVMGPAVIRSGIIGIWPTDPNDPYLLTPSANIQAAVEEMDVICREIDLPFVHTSDVVNGNPVCWTQRRAVPKCEIFVVGRHASLDMLDMVSFP